jgi:uncharacterized protein YegL
MIPSRIVESIGFCCGGQRQGQIPLGLLQDCHQQEQQQQQQYQQYQQYQQSGPLQTQQRRSRRPHIRSTPEWESNADGTTTSFPTIFADDDEIAASAAGAGWWFSQPEPESAEQGPLIVQTRVEYAALPRGQSQDIFGLVTVQAVAKSDDDTAAASRQPVDVVCVLDVSGSMRGNKLQLVQDAVSFVTGQMRPEDRLSIVSFNHEAKRCLRLRRMDDRGKDDARRETHGLVSSGGTSIVKGLEAALAVMEQRRHRNPVSALLLLTDGQDGSCQSRLSSLIERAGRANSAVYAFGFGADHDAAMLSNLAEHAQTPFSFVEDVNHIRAAFAGTIGGLVSVAAQKIELQLSCMCDLKAVHTPFSVRHDSETVRTVQIPDMFAGERRDVLVELKVLADQSNSSDSTVLLTASASYLDLKSGNTTRSPAVTMVTQRPLDEDQPELEPDIEVVAQRCRVEVTQALGEARGHGDAGRFSDAQASLSKGQERLKAAASNAMSSMLELELQEASERLQDRDRWEDGGRAELADMEQMHRTQRSTNLSSSSKSRVCRSSKAMYTNSVQKSWVSQSQE